MANVQRRAVYFAAFDFLRPISAFHCSHDLGLSKTNEVLSELFHLCFILSGDAVDLVLSEQGRSRLANNLILTFQ